jgi:hypothetical protein
VGWQSFEALFHPDRKPGIEGSRVSRCATGQYFKIALLDSPEDQQPQIVKRHYPGILQRFNWELPSDIDMADAASTSTLVSLGQKVAAQMDWKTILGE